MTTFNLHTLGWKSFQDLCATILTEILGQTFQTFSPGHDGGRDGAFRGHYQPQGGESLGGSFTAQCKFTNTPGKSLTVSDITPELPKARQLNRRGLADIYLLLTNYRVSAEVDAMLRSAMRSVGVKNFLAFGEDRIEQFIRESPRLRHLVPRVYGLGDLSEILDERAYAQAEAVLLMMQDDLKKFVPTYAYARGMESLARHGCVFLLGEPACGKTATAATLVLAAIDTWRCRFMKLHEISDLMRHWNPAEPQQLFWIDDVFGATQYQEQLADQWNRSVAEIRAARRTGARFLFTSRDYIYAKARPTLKLDVFPVDEMQLVIDVENLTSSEKRSILYNHVKMGTQSVPVRTKIKAVADRIVDQATIRPEIARRLGQTAFTPGLTWTFTGISDFFRNPESFLRDVIRQLSPLDRSALGLLFIHGGVLNIPLILTDEDRQSLEQLGGSSAEVSRSLSAMEGTFVRREHADGEYSWSFKHPTIADAVAAFIGENPMLLDLYIRGAAMSRLARTVTCGEVTVTGSALVIPRSRFSLVLAKLADLRSISSGREVLLNFLGTRCDAHFLRAFVERHPKVWHQLICEESPLDEAACRFLEAGRRFQLLPARHEEALRRRLLGDAFRMMTALHLRAPVRDLFSEEERSAMTATLVAMVQERIDDIVDEVTGKAEFAFDPAEPAGDALRFLEELAIETDDAAATDQLEQTITLLRRLVDDIDVARTVIVQGVEDDPEDEEGILDEMFHAVFDASSQIVPYDDRFFTSWDLWDVYESYSYSPYWDEDDELNWSYDDWSVDPWEGADLEPNEEDDQLHSYERLYEGARSGVGHIGRQTVALTEPMWARDLAQTSKDMPPLRESAEETTRRNGARDDSSHPEPSSAARSFFDDLDL
jgi:hypothetical protein